MKSMRVGLLFRTVLCAELAQHCGAQTNVSGVIVDKDGEPIAGIRCSASHVTRPAPRGVTVIGPRQFVLSDKEGKFSIPLREPNTLVDLQFDEDGGSFGVTNGVATWPTSKYAPAFLYKVRPADGPVRVVVAEGKILRGRIVWRELDEVLPIPFAEVELQLWDENFRYESKKRTDAKGEFVFRIGEPPGKRPWRLCYAGKRLKVEYAQVEYAQVKPDTVMVLEVSVTMHPSPDSRTNDLLTAIEGLQTDSTNAMATLDDKHILAIGDRVSFRIVEGAEDLKSLVVLDSGELEVPYLGRFPAIGKTCKNLARALKAELEKDYYYQATVMVSVELMTKSRGRVYVVGPVRAPGPQEIPSDEVVTLSNAILRAGRFNR
jgi:hypothetical protein